MYAFQPYVKYFLSNNPLSVINQILLQYKPDYFISRILYADDVLQKLNLLYKRKNISLLNRIKFQLKFSQIIFFMYHMF